MFLGSSQSIYEIDWVEGSTYGQVRKQEEYELSRYYFEVADVDLPAAASSTAGRARRGAASKPGWCCPAYECALKCSHTFNVLDARGAVSVTERVGLMKRVRDLAVRLRQGVRREPREAGLPAARGEARESRRWRRWPMPRGEYLLEVRSEEIPARMLEPGVKELATRVFEELMARGIGPREVETGYTPRRLVHRSSPACRSASPTARSR